MKRLLSLLLVLMVASAATFTITDTADFDAGVKSNVATTTDQHTWNVGEFGLSFPYADKDANLASYWRLEEGAGTDVADETGTHDATLTSSDQWSTGKFDGGYDFDGIDDWVVVPDHDDLTFSIPAGGDLPFSVSAWIYMDDNTSVAILGKRGAQYQDASEYYIGVRSDSKLFLYMFDNTNQKRAGRYTDVGLNTATWYHIVVTYDGAGGDPGAEDGMTFYVDGDLRASTKNGFTGYVQMRNSNRDVYIGVNRIDNSYYSPLDGKIDEVKLYSKELSQAEITELYNSGNQYMASGNWTSATQTMPAYELVASTTIEHSGGLDANNYIDKVEWLVSGAVEATYDTNINSGSSTSITTPTSGSFSDVDDDFTVKLYLVGDGTASPAVESVTINTDQNSSAAESTIQNATGADSVNISYQNGTELPDGAALPDAAYVQLTIGSYRVVFNISTGFNSSFAPNINTTVVDFASIENQITGHDFAYGMFIDSGLGGITYSADVTFPNVMDILVSCDGTADSVGTCSVIGTNSASASGVTFTGVVGLTVQMASVVTVPVFGWEVLLLFVAAALVLLAGKD